MTTLAGAAQSPNIDKLTKEGMRFTDAFAACPVCSCELYDLEAYIGEKKDLAKLLPEVTSGLLAELNGWRKTVNAQMMAKNPNYDPKMVGTTPKKKGGH